MNSPKDGAVFIATLVMATFLMGSSFVAGKILIMDGIPALLLVAIRFYAASLIIFPFVLLDGKGLYGALFPNNLNIKDKITILLIGLCQTGGAMGFLFLAMKTISAPNGAILLFTNPLWVALFGTIFLHEKLKPIRIFGLIIGIFGVTLAIGVNIKINQNMVGGQFIGLLAGISWALATTINKKFNPKIGIWALSFWQMFIGASVLFLFAKLSGQTLPQHIGIKQYSWFLWLAGPGSALSFSLWFIALKKGGATNASSYLFLAPLFAILISFFILGDKLTPIQALGGGLIFLAIWLINHTPHSNSAHKKTIEAQSMGEM